MVDPRTEAEAALARAKKRLAESGRLDAHTRAEAIEALDELSKTLEPALAARPEDVRRLAHSVEALAREATRPEASASLMRAGIASLNEATERLEQRLPMLVGLAQRLSDALAQIGI